MKFRLGQKCEPARVRGIERWKRGRRKRVRARVGERDPFRSIKANKWRRRWGCWWRTGPGREGRSGKGNGKERKALPWAEPTGALWVYAIKNVNICRRLVIGCKYGGGARYRDQMGRGGPRSSFVSLFIGMHGRAPRRAAPKPTLPVEAPRERAQWSSPPFIFILIRSRLVSKPALPLIRDVLISNAAQLRGNGNRTRVSDAPRRKTRVTNEILYITFSPLI